MLPIIIINSFVIVILLVNFVIYPLSNEWKIRKEHKEEIEKAYEWASSKEEAEFIIKDLMKEWRKQKDDESKRIR